MKSWTRTWDKITYELIGKFDDFKNWQQQLDMNEKPTFT